MQITKFVHSCIIVESNGKRVLVDPGNYSWQSGLVKPELLAGIDAVVVTHIHPDHLYEDFAKAVKEASPDAKWYGPQQVVDQLAEWEIEGSSTSSDEKIRFVESQHADLTFWLNEQPEHASFVLFEDVLVGGDCHTLTDSHGARIFAAAINGGPWGTVIGCIKMVDAMGTRPQAIIPLHDWHFNDAARQAIYAKLPEALSPFGVEFVALENGVTKQL